MRELTDTATIQEIQLKAVTRPGERSESPLLNAAPVHAELERAHARIAHLERQLQQRAPPGRSPADSAAVCKHLDVQDSVEYDPDVVLELQRRMAQMSEAAAADLHAALGLNAELKGKVRDLEEGLMASAIHAAEKQLAHGAEVARLEQQLQEGAAVSAEKTRLLLHAEEHIKRLQRQGSAWGREPAERDHDGGAAAAAGLSQELALLRLQLAKQRVGQEEAEGLHRSQLAEAQVRLRAMRAPTLQRCTQTQKRAYLATNRSDGIMLAAPATAPGNPTTWGPPGNCTARSCPRPRP
jgi:hypothetical protein